MSGGAWRHFEFMFWADDFTRRVDVRAVPGEDGEPVLEFTIETGGGRGPDVVTRLDVSGVRGLRLALQRFERAVKER